MARPSWLVDSNRIATKIMSASGASDPQEVNWKSNPSKECPNCQHTIDNSDTTQEWPGLPRGVKFDPSDQEIIWHLLAKVGVGSLKPHPFIDEFVPTVNEDDGICYTHPQNLPGVKQDGSVSHFFHRAIKAYNTGTRKRRKIHGESFGDVRWHKTGRTKPVFLDGTQQGCKKIMVLYVSPAKGGGKPEKTSWVMHQYHLGTQEDEREGEYVISKVFYQQSQLKLSEKNELEVPEDVDSVIVKADPVTPKLVTPEPPSTGKRLLNFDAGQAVVDPYIQHHDEEYMEDEVEVEPPSTVKLLLNYDAEQVLVVPPAQYHNEEYMEDEVEAPKEQQLYCEDHITLEDQNNEMEKKNEHGEEPKLGDSELQYLLDSQQLVEGLSLCDELLQRRSPIIDHITLEDQNNEMEEKNEHGEEPKLGDSELQYLLDSQQLVEGLSLCDELLQRRSPIIDHITLEDQNNEMEEKNEHGEEPKLGDSELQYLLDSQQLVEGLSLCDELLQSQSPTRDGNRIDQELKSKPRLSDYAQLGKESWKKDLEECQNLDFDPPQNADNDADDLRLSQLVGSSDAADSRLSQLEFVSQDSYVSWGGSKLTFEAGDHQGC